MPLYIIRHTSVNVSKSVCYGQSDVDLATTFEEETNVVLAQLPKKIDRKSTRLNSSHVD